MKVVACRRYEKSWLEWDNAYMHMMGGLISVYREDGVKTQFAQPIALLNPTEFTLVYTVPPVEKGKEHQDR